jgi:hypothetical protein
MSGPKVTSSDGSTAIGGDVNAPVVNANLAPGAQLNLRIEQETTRELPSYLGAIIASFAKQALSEYAVGPRREVTKEVTEKLQYNSLSSEHRLIADYSRYSIVLEQAYLGAEQYNADARYLVRRKAGFVYQDSVRSACKRDSISLAGKLEYVRVNADDLLSAVVVQMMEDYKRSTNVKVEEEHAHLAVSLIVADAIIECEVLEKP